VHADAGVKASRHGGFTLLEVLLVMVLIGLAASTVVLSLSGNGPQRQLQQQAERLAAKLQLALDEAVLRRRELGLDVLSQGYRFLLLDADAGKWQVIETDRQLGPVELDTAFRLELELSGFSWEVDSAQDQEQRLFTGGSLFEDEELYEDSAFAEEEQALTPQVTILSSGDYTPFELRLSLPAEPELMPWRIRGDGLNPIQLDNLAGESGEVAG